MLTIRPYTPDDLPLILDSFVRDYVRVPYVAGLTRSQVRGLMVSLLSAPGWTCSVLCDDETPDEIIAYAVHRGPQEIAWCHSKGIYRGRKLTLQLLTAVGCTRALAVMTPFMPDPKAARALHARGWRLRFRPWIAVDTVTDGR